MKPIVKGLLSLLIPIVMMGCDNKTPIGMLGHNQIKGEIIYSDPVNQSKRNIVLKGPKGNFYHILIESGFNHSDEGDIIRIMGSFSNGERASLEKLGIKVPKEKYVAFILFPRGEMIENNTHNCIYDIGPGCVLSTTRSIPVISYEAGIKDSFRTIFREELSIHGDNYLERMNLTNKDEFAMIGDEEHILYVFNKWGILEKLNPQLRNKGYKIKQGTTYFFPDFNGNHTINGGTGKSLDKVVGNLILTGSRVLGEEGKVHKEISFQKL